MLDDEDDLEDIVRRMTRGRLDLMLGENSTAAMGMLCIARIAYDYI